MLVVIANHRRVEIAVRIDLRAAKERIVNDPSLTSVHDVTHAGCHQAFVECARVTNADRHSRQPRSDSASFEHQRQIWSGRLLSQHRGCAGRTCSDNDHGTIFQRAGRRTDHQLHRFIGWSFQFSDSSV